MGLYRLKIFRLTTTTLLLVGVSILILDPAYGRETAKENEFALHLSTDKTRFTVGDTPVFTATITNKSKKDIMLVPALDGSSSGMRFPKVLITKTIPANTPPAGPIGRCGNTNNIQSSNFQPVKKGETFTPLNEWVGLSHTQLSTPGKYTFQLTYDTTGDVKEWYGFMGVMSISTKKTIRKLLNDVPKMTLQSNVVTITVVEK